MITYREHRKELLKNKKVKEEYEKLLREYVLAKSMIKQRIKKKGSSRKSVGHFISL